MSGFYNPTTFDGINSQSVQHLHYIHLKVLLPSLNSIIHRVWATECSLYLYHRMNHLQQGTQYNQKIRETFWQFVCLTWWLYGHLCQDHSGLCSVNGLCLWWEIVMIILYISVQLSVKRNLWIGQFQIIQLHTNKQATKFITIYIDGVA